MTDADLPEVSVIVPCFNHAGYLEQCLKSIDSQELTIGQLKTKDS